METFNFDIEKPISSPTEDLLGFAPSAELFADFLFSLDRKETFTVAVTGSWGVGKTSFLNLVKDFMHKKHKKEMRTTVLLDLDASCLLTTKSMFVEYFKALRSKIEEWSGDREKSSLKSLFATLDSYSDELFDIFDMIPPLEGLGALAGKVKNKISGDVGEKSLKQRRDDLAEEIKRSGLHFIVFIDDIDRLPRKQIKSMFQLIYAIGKINYTKYILAYDKDIVSKAIKKFYKFEDGKEYLEKVVQQEIPMPKIRRDILQDNIIKCVENLDDFKNSKWKDERHSDLVKCYEVCVKPFVKNLRDVHLVMNSFKFAYAFSIGKELEFADLLVISALKAKNMRLYEFIYANHDLFFLTPSLLYGNTSQSEVKKIVEDKIERSGITKTDIDILCFLFSTFAYEYYPEKVKLNKPRDILKGNRRNIGMEFYFPLYFIDRLPVGVLPKEEFIGIVCEYDESLIVEKLKLVFDNENLFEFTMELGRTLEENEIEKDRYATLTRAFILFYLYAAKYKKIIFFPSNAKTMVHTTQEYMAKVGQENAFVIAKEFICGKDFVCLSHLFADVVNSEKLRMKEKDNNENIFSPRNWKEVFTLFIARIKELISANEGMVLFDDGRNFSLFVIINEQIKEGCPDKEIFIDWMKKNLENPKQMLIFYDYFDRLGFGYPEYLKDIAAREDDIIAKLTDAEIATFTDELKNIYSIWFDSRGKKYMKTQGEENV